VLLDLGVSLSFPAWRSRGVDRDKSGPDTWHVELVRVTAGPGSIMVRACTSTSWCRSTGATSACSTSTSSRTRSRRANSISAPPSTGCAAQPGRHGTGLITTMFGSWLAVC